MKIITVLLLVMGVNQPVIATPNDATETEQTIIASADDSVVETPGIIIEGYPAEGIIIPFKEYYYDESQPHLTKQSGVFYGPSGKETYYNLPMGRVINYMRDLGYTTEEYPYWVRSDGAKMLGDYVMVAADLSVYSKGSIVPTSLGKGIVCDTGAFAGSSVALDIAVNW